MTYRFVASGGIVGNRVIDEQSGDDVTRRLGAKAISVRCEAGQTARLEVDLRIRAECDGLPWPVWRAVNPATGKLQKLKGLVFEDGSSVDLSTPALQSLSLSEPVAAKLDCADLLHN
jgi:hypothetical protein